MKATTYQKFQTLFQFLSEHDDWFRWADLEEAKDIPSASTIRKYCKLAHRVYDHTYNRYVEWDGVDLHDIYEDEDQFRSLSDREIYHLYYEEEAEAFLAQQGEEGYEGFVSGEGYEFYKEFLGPCRSHEYKIVEINYD